MDRKLIDRATFNDEEPTPGYIFKDIIDMTYLDAPSVQRLAEYLVIKVKNSIDNQSSFTLMKTLKVIRQLCLHGHEEFQSLMAAHVDVFRGAIAYRGGTSHSDGNAVRRNVKSCASQAIDAIFATRRKQDCFSHSHGAPAGSSKNKFDSSSLIKENISREYDVQHRKSAYIAPVVPLGVLVEDVGPPVGSEDLIELVKKKPSPKKVPTCIVSLTQEMINCAKELESPDLNRYYEQCNALENSDGELWQRASEVLNEGLSGCSSWKSKYNAASVIEYLLRKDIKTVNDFFAMNRARLSETQGGVHFSLRRKVIKILNMLPNGNNPQHTEDSQELNKKMDQCLVVESPLKSPGQAQDPMRDTLQDFFILPRKCNKSHPSSKSNGASIADNAEAPFADLHDL